MKTLTNESDRRELLDRLNNLRIDSHRRWGRMTAHQMICHLSDSLRAGLGEKHVSPNSSLFKRTIYKWAALWVPFPWPHDVQTHPEIDQQQGGTQPLEFATDVEAFRTLFNRYCGWNGNFAPHAKMGQMSRTERMRHAYLHIHHHFRQFGA
jgi:hypothetical protein